MNGSKVSNAATRGKTMMGVKKNDSGDEPIAGSDTPVRWQTSELSSRE